MKIKFDSNSLEDMKLVKTMLAKRIREREAEAEVWRKMNERYDKSLLNLPNISDSPSIAYSILSRKPDSWGDIVKKEKDDYIPGRPFRDYSDVVKKKKNNKK